MAQQVDPFMIATVNRTDAMVLMWVHLAHDIMMRNIKDDSLLYLNVVQPPPAQDRLTVRNIIDEKEKTYDVYAAQNIIEKIGNSNSARNDKIIITPTNVIIGDDNVNGILRCMIQYFYIFSGLDTANAAAIAAAIVPNIDAAVIIAANAIAAAAAAATAATATATADINTAIAAAIAEQAIADAIIAANAIAAAPPAAAATANIIAIIIVASSEENTSNAVKLAALTIAGAGGAAAISGAIAAAAGGAAALLALAQPGGAGAGAVALTEALTAAVAAGGAATAAAAAGAGGAAAVTAINKAHSNVPFKQFLHAYITNDVNNKERTRSLFLTSVRDAEVVVPTRGGRYAKTKKNKSKSTKKHKYRKMRRQCVNK